LLNSHLSRSELSDTDLRRAHLPVSDLSNADLTEAGFEGAGLSQFTQRGTERQVRSQIRGLS
jgi:uncharacterized protein YjbI with pentapeptide repeats